AKRTGFWAAGVWVYVFWNLFSLLGALAGQYIADPGAWGLDAAAAAAFLALLWPRLRRADAVAIAVAAAFVALLTTPVLPSGLPVLAAALVAAVAGLLPRRPGAGPDGPGGPRRCDEPAVGRGDRRLGAVLRAEVDRLPGPARCARTAAHRPHHHDAADRPAGCSGRRAVRDKRERAGGRCATAGPGGRGGAAGAAGALPGGGDRCCGGGGGPAGARLGLSGGA